MTTPDRAARVVARIADRLTDESDLANIYARAVLAQAVQNAAGHPTPQSRIAAATFTVRGHLIRSDSPLAWGSEKGSTIYRQFGPRQDSAWLMRSGDQPAPVLVAKGWLDGMVTSETRRG